MLIKFYRTNCKSVFFFAQSYLKKYCLRTLAKTSCFCLFSKLHNFTKIFRKQNHYLESIMKSLISYQTQSFYRLLDFQVKKWKTFCFFWYNLIWENFVSVWQKLLVFVHFWSCPTSFSYEKQKFVVNMHVGEVWFS